MNVNTANRSSEVDESVIVKNGVDEMLVHNDKGLDHVFRMKLTLNVWYALQTKTISRKERKPCSLAAVYSDIGNQFQVFSYQLIL